MTVGFHAPLPPARTGVADYAAALLAALRLHGDIRVGAERASVPLYHLGNNPLHREIYRRALERPGVAVLHDAVLHHFLLSSLGEAEYIQEFVYNYGEWHRSTARDLWKDRGASAADPRYFAFPMLRRVCERARAVVVHNPAADEMVRAHAPAARVLEIPHLYSPRPLPEAEALRYRGALGIPPGAFVFGLFGYLRESKRLLTVLRVFAEVRREQPRAWLLVAGEFVSRDLERAAAPLLPAPGIVRLPHLGERKFRLAAAAADACINLRSPAAGETSGIAIRLMGMGRPVLLTDTRENARFPEDACVRIPSGPAEPASLRGHMLLLTSRSTLSREIGFRGARHIARHHAVERIAGEYWKILCDCCG